jgi:hypothetical protein
MGTYPVFCCDNWNALADDLNDLSIDLVSIVLITDPFGKYNRATLELCFDNTIKLKDHYVLDLTRPLNESISKSNRTAAKLALRNLQVRIVPKPLISIDTWMTLYGSMVDRLNIKGIRKFSRDGIEQQLNTPGAMLFEAKSGDQGVGLDVVFVDNDVAYGHACAFNEEGYKARASYATRWSIIEHLQGKVHYLDFGGGLSTKEAGESDGLTAYKKRWTNCTKPVFICTSVRNQKLYTQLTNQFGSMKSNYFPNYRAEEF